MHKKNFLEKEYENKIKSLNSKDPEYATKVKQIKIQLAKEIIKEKTPDFLIYLINIYKSNRKSYIFLLTISIFSIFFGFNKKSSQETNEFINNIEFKIAKIKDRYASVTLESTLKSKKLTCSISVNSFNYLLEKRIILEKIVVSGNFRYWPDTARANLEVLEVNGISHLDTLFCNY